MGEEVENIQVPSSKIQRIIKIQDSKDRWLAVAGGGWGNDKCGEREVGSRRGAEGAEVGGQVINRNVVRR